MKKSEALEILANSIWENFDVSLIESNRIARHVLKVIEQEIKMLPPTTKLDKLEGQDNTWENE